MRQERKGQLVRKVTAFLLVLVMVLALPIMTQATDDVPEGAVRVQPRLDLGTTAGFDIFGVTNQITIYDQSEIERLAVGRETFGWYEGSRLSNSAWYIEHYRSFSPGTSAFERIEGGVPVVYVEAPARLVPVGFFATVPHRVWPSSVWDYDGVLLGGLERNYGMQVPSYFTFVEPGIYMIRVVDAPLSDMTPREGFFGATVFPFFYLVVESATDSSPYTPQSTTPTTAPNLATASSWAQESINSAFTHGLIPQGLQSQYTQATTRAEFSAFAVTLYETITGREITERTQFNDTTDLNVQKIGGLGVVNGVGSGNFAPDRTITRQEAAVLLARLAYAIGQPLPPSAPTFADNADISAWAVDGVGQMQAAGIMGGVGGNNFAPDGTYTREQSIVTMLRLFDLLS